MKSYEEKEEHYKKIMDDWASQEPVRDSNGLPIWELTGGPVCDQITAVLMDIAKNISTKTPEWKHKDEIDPKNIIVMDVVDPPVNPVPFKPFPFKEVLPELKEE